VFGRRYFGRKYWGRYWGPTGSGPLPPPIPGTMAEAIMVTWTARGLAVAVGPLTQARTRAGQPAPTATFRITRGSPALLTSSSRHYEYRIAFCIREPGDGDRAHAKAQAVAAVFDQCSLYWAGGQGKAGRLTQETWTSRSEPRPSAGSELVYADDLEYMARSTGVR
jgi:hypothetical protein